MTTTVADVRDIDLFTDENLTNPYPLYRQLRDAGPAVFLNRVGCWAVPRYADVRASLDDWKTFTSAQGVGMNDEVNGQLVGTVLASDPPLHDTLRSVLADRLSPRALRDLTDSIRQQAETLVEDVVGRGTFDVVNDLARVFPVSVVGEVLGGPHHQPPAPDSSTGATESSMPSVQQTVGARPESRSSRSSSVGCTS